MSTDDRAVNALVDSATKLERIAVTLETIPKFHQQMSKEHDEIKACIQNGGKWREKALFGLVALLVAGVLAFAGIKVSTPGLPSVEGPPVAGPVSP